MQDNELMNHMGGTPIQIHNDPLGWLQTGIASSATEAGAASAYAEEEKKKKYARLSHSYFFQPVAVETSGSVGAESMAFLEDLGHRVKMAIGESQSFSFLLQRLAVAVQVGNAISVLGTLGSYDAEV